MEATFKDAESDAFKRACMRFGLGVELWSGSVQSEEEATLATEPEDRVEVTKVDMRKKSISLHLKILNAWKKLWIVL